MVKSARDFHERSYNLNPVKAVYWLSVIFLAALFLIQCFFGVMMSDKAVYKFDNLVFSATVINGLFMLLVISATYLVYRMQKIVLVAEFQSLLFSSAMRGGALFSIVFSKDHVLYIDQNTSDFFNINSVPSSTEELLDFIDLGTSSRQQMTESITNNKPCKIKYQHSKKNLNLDLLPLDRPKGFFVLRCFS